MIANHDIYCQNFPDLASKFGLSIDIRLRWLKGRRGQVEGGAILQGTMAKDAEAMAAYEERLCERNLPDIPFHMVDLLHGHGDYELLDPAQRKPMLYAFATFVRTLPITYAP